MLTTHKKNNSKGYKSISVFRDEISDIIGLAKNQTSLIKQIKEYLSNTKFPTYFNLEKAQEAFVNSLRMLDSPPFQYHKPLPFNVKKVIAAIPGLKRVPVTDPWKFILNKYEPLSTKEIKEKIIKHNSVNLDPDFGWQKEKHQAALTKIIDILDSDPNIKRLIAHTLFGEKRSAIPELIINKKIALNNLKVLVNFTEDIKTNTNDIYYELNKEFRQTDIYDIVLDCFNGNKAKIKRKKAYEKKKIEDAKKGIEKSP